MNSTTHPVTTASCHQEHQHWQQIIQQQAEEIRQLRALLLEVMNHYNTRSLRHDAVDYFQDLSHLQAKLDQLNRNLICTGTDCPPIRQAQICSDTHFGLSATIERHTAAFMHEFTRVKDGCLQFLSGMMSLNML
ncbi:MULTISPECIES: hypothetical protein [unclassified Spirosoma]|uniref:hypothetical protein n=1 Tax=unclassified Spirosoma TaxID=2621999 RepID=UPI0025F79BD0|nr:MULTISPECIES: hypothetical protein [unclassified Spirosoma]